MPESFGARLRRTREEQQIALVTIAQQTKIKMSLLEGLERDDVSHWPSGLYRRAYMRTYAQAIGLDPDTVVREFLQVHPEPEEVFETALAQALAADAARANGGSATRFRSLIGSALGSFTRLRRPAEYDDAEAAEVSPPEVAGFSSLSAQHGRAVSAFDASASFEAPEEPVASTFVAPSPVEPALIDVADDGGVETEPAPALAVVDASHVEEPSEDIPPQMDVTASSSATESTAPVGREMDWAMIAELCTGLGRVDTLEDLRLRLQDAARLLDAGGLIVWVWNHGSERLEPALAHGYSDRVLAQLPALRRESDNVTAAAFRSAQSCAIDATGHANGALAVPLQGSNGPSGVLALELHDGGERAGPVRAAATIVAALLARLVDRPTAAEIEADEKARAAEMEARAAEMQARAAEMEAFKSAVRRVHARR